MKFIRLCLWVCLGLGALPARAADEAGRHVSRPAVREELIATAQRQLAAFRANDWEAAYGLAAETFRARLSLRQFVALITRNHPIVWKNARAEFGLPQDDGVRAVVPVHVATADGRSEAYDYIFLKERTGWGIIGVVPRGKKAGEM
jgi:hypothetical protein